MLIKNFFKTNSKNGLARHLSRLSILCISLTCISLTIVACDTGIFNHEERLEEAIVAADLAFDDGRIEDAKTGYQRVLELDARQLLAYERLVIIAQQEQDIQAAFTNLSQIALLRPDDFEVHAQIAEILLLAGQIEEALLVAEKLRELRPEDKQGFLFITGLTQRLGYIEQTFDQARAFLELAPNDPDALAFLVWEQIDSGDEEEALALIEQGLSAHPVDIQLNQAKAFLLMESGEFGQIEDSFVQLVNEYPLDVSVHQTLSQVYLAQNRLDDASELMSTLATNEGATAPQHLAEVDFLIQINQPDMAFTRLFGYLSLEPNHVAYQLSLARLYQAQEDLSNAKVAYQRLLDIPANTAMETAGASALAVQEVYDLGGSNLAGLLLAEGDIDSARNLVTGVLDRSPEFPQAKYVRAGILYSEGEIEAAIEDLKTVIEIDSSNLQAQELLANIHLEAGEYSEALNLFEQLDRLDISTQPVIIGQADALLGLGHQQLAKNLLQEWLSANPEDTEALDRYILAAIATQDYEEALSSLDRLQEIAGEEARIHAARGSILAQQGKSTLAIEALEEALLSRSQAPNVADTLVRLYLNTGELDRGIEFLEDRLPRDADNLERDLSLAFLYATAQDFPMAESLYQQLTEDYPQDHRPYLAWSNLLVVNEQLPRAQSVLDQGFSLAVRLYPLYAVQAMIFELQENYSDALVTYENMIALDSSSELAINNYIYLAITADGSPEALARAREIAQPAENTEDPAILDTLAWLYYHLGDYETAYSYALEATASNLDVPDIYYHFGKIELARGNEISAKQAFELALEMDGAQFSGASDAREILESLQ